MSDCAPYQPSELARSVAGRSSLQRFVGRHSSATLYKGDCLHVLPEMEYVDCIITDPPYGIGFNSGHRAEAFGAMHDDDITNVVWLAHAARLLKPGGAIYSCARWDVLGQWKRFFEFFGLAVKSCIVWDKQQTGMGDLTGSYAPQHEMILMAARGKHLLRRGRKPDILRTQRIGADREHPTQKPTALMAELILNSTDEGAIVLDPFMGSGTTGVACATLKRNFIGIERDDRYYKTACDRIAHELDGALL